MASVDNVQSIIKEKGDRLILQRDCSVGEIGKELEKLGFKKDIFVLRVGKRRFIRVRL